MVQSISYTAHYNFLELALRDQSRRNGQLIREIATFVPLTKCQIAEKMRSQYEALKAKGAIINKDIDVFIDEQAELASPRSMQIHNHFASQFGANFVNTAILSAALAEATINAVLSIGLFSENRSEIFELIDYSDLKKKWEYGPKLFASNYNLPKGQRLYQTLVNVVRLRNAYLHYKVQVSSNETDVKTDGSDHAAVNFDIEDSSMIRRMVELPAELLQNLVSQIEDQSLKFRFEHILTFEK